MYSSTVVPFNPINFPKAKQIINQQELTQNVLATFYQPSPFQDFGMVSKRCLDDENCGSECSVQDAKRCRPSLLTVAREVMRVQSLQSFLSELEPLLRKVVREEVERALVPSIWSASRSSIYQIQASGVEKWQLHFKNRLNLPLFTGSKIEAEDSEPIEIVILDSSSRRMITSGVLSSVKVEILVLDGDFGSDDHEHWTEKDFDSHVIRQREGKRPLLTGDLVVTLRDGVGTIGELSFTDNSSWIRSRKFRLGARVVRGSYIGERIQEAKTEAFVVKDHRGELYKKHYPPSLNDDVWRLEKIGKDGAFHNRLAAQGINTVEDFLKLLVVDAATLRNILGNGMSSKTWEATVEHARTCVLDNKLYMNYSAGQQVGLVFNSVFDVVGVAFDGQSYQSIHKLSKAQSMVVETMKQHAYRNLNQMFEINGLSIDSIPRPLPRLDAPSIPGLSLDLQYPDFHITRAVAHQDGLVEPLDFNHPNNVLAEGLSQLTDITRKQSFDPAELFNSVQRNSFATRDFYNVGCGNFGTEWDSGHQGPTGSVFPSGHAVVGDNCQFQIPSWFPVAAAVGSQGSGWIEGSGDESGGSIVCPLQDFSLQLSRNCKANIQWLKLRAALKWGFLDRRAVAARRARILELEC